VSYEDQFLAKLANGENISQDEYDQMCQDMPLELIAAALARRFRWTEDLQTIIQAARLYQHAGMLYEALELCSRFPKVMALNRIIMKILPAVRKEYQDIYPGTDKIGKLLDEAFLVINLTSGTIIRFPPIIPSTLQDMTSAQNPGANRPSR